MSKILLISLNARFSHSNPALYYLRNYVESLTSDYQIEILELAIKQQVGEIVAEIYNHQPDACFFSVYIWNSEIIKYLVRDLKKVSPNTKIILGGPEVSYNSQEWLDSYSDIDYIISGAGEEAFKYLLEQNLTVPEKIIHRVNPPFNQIAFPYHSSDLAKLQGHYVYYEASRGCPFKCSYCLSSRSDQKLEFRTHEQIEKELLFFINSDLKIVKLVDRSFNAKAEFSRHIWQFLIANYREGLTWHFEIYPDLLKDKDFVILSQAPKDYFQLEIGIQSVNPITLKAVNRPEEWSRVKPKIQRLLALGNMHIHVDLIAGLPYENLAEFQTSFNEIYSLKADEFQLGFLKVLPGTEISDRQTEFGIKNSVQAPYTIYSTNWLQYSELLLLEKVEFLLDRYANSGAFKISESELASCFSSPFEFYLELANYRTEFYPEFQVKEWEKNAAFLVDFNQKYNLLDELFLKDCLLRDWSFTGHFNHRPPLLGGHQAEEFRKKPAEIVRELAKNNLLPTEQSELILRNVSKITVLAPLTQEFMSKYLQGCNLLLTLKTDQNKIEIYLKV